jgi:hypothetical protein
MAALNIGHPWSRPTANGVTVAGQASDGRMTKLANLVCQRPVGLRCSGIVPIGARNKHCCWKNSLQSSNFEPHSYDDLRMTVGEVIGGTPRVLWHSVVADNLPNLEFRNISGSKRAALRPMPNDEG